MPKFLKDMRLDEISLVDEPASPGARVALFKRRGQDAVAETANAINFVKAAFAEAELPAAAFSAFDAALTAAFAGMIVQKGDRIEFDPAHAEVANLPGIARLVKGTGESLRTIFLDPDVTDPDALVRTTTTQLVAAVDEVIKANGKEPGNGFKPCADCKDREVCKTKGACAMSDKDNDIQKRIDDAVSKAVGEAVAKAKEEAAAEVKKAREEAAAAIAKANEQIAAINEKAADAERLAKAKTLVAGVPGVTAEFVAKQLKGMTPEEAADFEKGLASLREQAKLGKITKEIGGSGAGEGAAASASEAIAKAAAEIRKSNPKLTNAQAVDKALVENPSLYEAYINVRAA